MGKIEWKIPFWHKIGGKEIFKAASNFFL